MATWIYTCGKPNNTTHTCKWVHVNLVKSEKKSLACNNVHWPVWRCYPWGKLGKGDRGQLCFLSFPDLKLFQNKKIKKKTATYNYNEDNIMCTFWHQNQLSEIPVTELWLSQKRQGALFVSNEKWSELPVLYTNSTTTAVWAHRCDLLHNMLGVTLEAHRYLQKPCRRGHPGHRSSSQSAHPEAWRLTSFLPPVQRYWYHEFQPVKPLQNIVSCQFYII